MNKRQRKKEENKTMKDQVIYLKLYINKNDKYNPVLKCKSIKKFFSRAMHLGKKYHCDVGFRCPVMDEIIESIESESNEYN